MDTVEVMDSARLTVDNLFKTQLCKSFAIREDNSGGAILTMRFKKRGPPLPNGQSQMYVPKQYTAYKVLNQSQNLRNKNRLENYYSNGRYSKARYYDNRHRNYQIPQGGPMNPEARVFRPRTSDTMHPSMSQVPMPADVGIEPVTAVDPGGSSQNPDVHSESEPPFYEPENLISVETVLLAGLDAMTKPCEKHEECDLPCSEPIHASILSETVCDPDPKPVIDSIVSDVHKPPDPPDSAPTGTARLDHTPDEPLGYSLMNEQSAVDQRSPDASLEMCSMTKDELSADDVQFESMTLEEYDEYLDSFLNS